MNILSKIQTESRKFKKKNKKEEEGDEENYDWEERKRGEEHFVFGWERKRGNLVSSINIRVS